MCKISRVSLEPTRQIHQKTACFLQKESLKGKKLINGKKEKDTLFSQAPEFVEAGGRVRLYMMHQFLTAREE